MFAINIENLLKKLNFAIVYSKCVHEYKKNIKIKKTN